MRGRELRPATSPVSGAEYRLCPDLGVVSRGRYECVLRRVSVYSIPGVFVAEQFAVEDGGVAAAEVAVAVKLQTGFIARCYRLLRRQLQNHCR